jgi:alkanesulfonate monooxygenase SsuD/methylene tetrahydromethanopterin reductase-like flavin-dependent oxidoreductase (luciferase family)
MTMQFGLFHTVQWPEGSSQVEVYNEAIREAVRVDELGFHSVWLTEHHFTRHGLISDSLNVLAHIAALTTHVRLGTAVAVLPFHSPLRLAESAAIVDLLSGGRLDFGIGRGYQPLEFNGFGVDMADRAERFEESIELILKGWTTHQAFEHKGEFWQYGMVDPQPKPLQSPHPPIWVATDSPAGLRHCVERDWGVMFAQGRSLDVLEEQVGRYREALDAVGKPWDSSKLLVARGLYVAETDDEAWATAGKPYVSFLEFARGLGAPVGAKSPDNPFDTETMHESVVFGSPETCTATLRRIQEIGVDYVLFFIRYADLPHERIMRSLDLFAGEVAPGLTAQVVRA